MDVHDGFAAVQLLENQPELGVAQPQIPVAGRNTKAIGLEHIQRIFDFFEAAVDVMHRQRSEQAETARMIHADPRAIFVVFPR